MKHIDQYTKRLLINVYYHFKPYFESGDMFFMERKPFKGRQVHPIFDLMADQSLFPGFAAGTYKLEDVDEDVRRIWDDIEMENHAAASLNGDVASGKYWVEFEPYIELDRWDRFAHHKHILKKAGMIFDIESIL